MFSPLVNHSYTSLFKMALYILILFQYFSINKELHFGRKVYHVFREFVNVFLGRPPTGENIYVSQNYLSHRFIASITVIHKAYVD